MHTPNATLMPCMLSVVMLKVDALSVFLLNTIMLSDITLSVIMLNVVLLSVIMLKAIVLTIIMLSVIMLGAVMLSVTMQSAIVLTINMLSVIMLSVVMPTVASPLKMVIKFECMSQWVIFSSKPTTTFCLITKFWDHSYTTFTAVIYTSQGFTVASKILQNGTWATSSHARADLAVNYRFKSFNVQAPAFECEQEKFTYVKKLWPIKRLFLWRMEI
jgi:hypothetical protein